MRLLPWIYATSTLTRCSDHQGQGGSGAEGTITARDERSGEVSTDQIIQPEREVINTDPAAEPQQQKSASVTKMDEK